MLEAGARLSQDHGSGSTASTLQDLLQKRLQRRHTGGWHGNNTSWWMLIAPNFFWKGVCASVKNWEVDAAYAKSWMEPTAKEIWSMHHGMWRRVNR
jgi:hypothetical protein